MVAKNAYRAAAILITAAIRLSEHVKHTQKYMCKSKTQNTVTPSSWGQVITQEADNDPQTCYDPADCHSHPPHFTKSWLQVKTRLVSPAETLVIRR